MKLVSPGEEVPQEPSLEQLGDSLKNAELDYKFAQLFTHSGGIFNYVADEREALQTLSQILQVEALDHLFCCDPELQNFLRVLGVSYSEQLQEDHPGALITCEYLIAYDGKIMLSHHNILHYHSSRLPDKIVVMATVSQIVSNLNEAMSKIKRTGNVKNLTSISGSQNRLDAPIKPNKIFLILLEG